MEPAGGSGGQGQSVDTIDTLSIAIRLAKSLRYAGCAQGVDGHATPAVVGIRSAWANPDQVGHCVKELAEIVDRSRAGGDHVDILSDSAFRAHISALTRFASSVSSMTPAQDTFFVAVAERLATIHRVTRPRHGTPLTNLQMRTSDRIASCVFELALGAIARQTGDPALVASCRSSISTILSDSDTVDDDIGSGNEDDGDAPTATALVPRIPDLSSGIGYREQSQPRFTSTYGSDWEAIPGRAIFRTSSSNAMEVDFEGLTCNAFVNVADTGADLSHMCSRPRNETVPRNVPDEDPSENDDVFDDDDDEQSYLEDEKEADDSTTYDSREDSSRKAAIANASLEKRFHEKHDGLARLLRACTKYVAIVNVHSSAADLVSRLSITSSLLGIVASIERPLPSSEAIVTASIATLCAVLDLNAHLRQTVARSGCEYLQEFVTLSTSIKDVIARILHILKHHAPFVISQNARIASASSIMHSVLCYDVANFDELHSQTAFLSFTVDPSLRSRDDVAAAAASPAGIGDSASLGGSVSTSHNSSCTNLVEFGSGESTTLRLRVLEGLALGASLVPFAATLAADAIDDCSLGSARSSVKLGPASSFHSVRGDVIVNAEADAHCIHIGSQTLDLQKYHSFEECLRLLVGETGDDSLPITIFDKTAIAFLMLICSSKTSADVVGLREICASFTRFLVKVLSTEAGLGKLMRFVRPSHLEVVVGASLCCDSLLTSELLSLANALSRSSALSDDLRHRVVKAVLSPSTSFWAYCFPAATLKTVYVMVGPCPSARSILIDRLLVGFDTRVHCLPEDLSASMPSMAQDVLLLVALLMADDSNCRASALQRLMQTVIRKTNISFGPVVNVVHSAWASILFVLSFLVNRILLSPSSQLPVESLDTSFDMAARVDTDNAMHEFELHLLEKFPQRVQCPALTSSVLQSESADQFCDRLWHIMLDLSRKISARARQQEADDVSLTVFQTYVWHRLSELLCVMIPAAQCLPSRYETLSMYSPNLDPQCPTTAHFVRQCMFFSRLGPDRGVRRLMPPDPLLWLLDIIDICQRKLLQAGPDVAPRMWWLHYAIDASVQTLGFHLLSSDSGKHLPEMFILALLHLVDTYAAVIRKYCSSSLQVQPNLQEMSTDFLEVFASALEFGIGDASHLPPGSTDVADISLPDAFKPLSDFWRQLEKSHTLIGPPMSLLRSMQTTLLVVHQALETSLHTWPDVVARLASVAANVLEPLSGSRLAPLSQFFAVYAQFISQDGCASTFAGRSQRQDLIIHLGHVHNVLHRALLLCGRQGHMADDDSSVTRDPLVSLIVDCLAHLRRQQVAWLQEFYSASPESLGDIVQLIVSDQVAIVHEALRLALILTENHDRDNGKDRGDDMVSRFRHALMAPGNGAVDVVIRAAASVRAGPTERRIQEQCWTLLRRLLPSLSSVIFRGVLDRGDPFLNSVACKASALAESVLLDGSSPSAMYAIVSTLCRTASPQQCISCLNALLPRLNNRAAACVLDALDELIEVHISRKVGKNDASGVSSVSSVALPSAPLVLSCASATESPDSASCAVFMCYPETSSAPFELCPFCVRYCFYGKSYDIASSLMPVTSVRRRCGCSAIHVPVASEASISHDELSHSLPSAISADLLASLEQFISSRMNMIDQNPTIGQTTSLVSRIYAVQILPSGVLSSSVSAPGHASSSGSPAQGGSLLSPIMCPPESAEVSAALRVSPAVTRLACVLHQFSNEPLLVVAEQCAVNVYDRWRPPPQRNISNGPQTRMCSTSHIPFRIVGVVSHGDRVAAYGARHVHVLSYDASGKKHGRFRLELALEGFETNLPMPLVIVGLQWTSKGDLLVATSRVVFVFRLPGDSASARVGSVDPVYTTICSPEMIIKSAAICRDRYVYTMMADGTVLVDDFVHGMGRLESVAVRSSPVNSKDPSVIPAASSGVSVHYSRTLRRLVCTWSLGTRIYCLTADGSSVDVERAPISVPVNAGADLRQWVDVHGSHDVIASIATDSNAIILVQINPSSNSAHCRSIGVSERGRRCTSLVDVSPSLQKVSILVHQEHGSLHELRLDTLPKTAPNQVVSVPSFQSFFSPPDPSGPDGSRSWNSRDPAIFDRARVVADVPVRGTSSSTHLIRDIAKSLSEEPGASDIGSSTEIALTIETCLPPGHCIVAIRAILDRPNSAMSSFAMTLPSLHRTVRVTLSSASPNRRAVDVPLSRWESAQLSALWFIVDLQCSTQALGNAKAVPVLSVLSSVEVYSMPRSEFHRATLPFLFPSKFHQWPWPLPNDSDISREVTHEVLLGAALRICQRLGSGCADEHHVILGHILGRVVEVIGRPSFELLDSQFHEILIDVLQSIKPPLESSYLGDLAHASRLGGRLGLRALLSCINMRLQVCGSDEPSCNAARLILGAIDDSLTFMGKFRAEFCSLLTGLPSFMESFILVGRRVFLQEDTAPVMHTPDILPSFMELVCDSAMLLADREADGVCADVPSLLGSVVEFIGLCLVSPFQAVRHAAFKRSYMTFASASQQLGLKTAQLRRSEVEQQQQQLAAAAVPDDSAAAADAGNSGDQTGVGSSIIPNRMSSVLNGANSYQYSSGTGLRSGTTTRYRCDLCDICPIVGPRYHCTHPDCADFDMCVPCFTAGDFTGSTHVSSHEVVLLNEQASSQPRAGSSHNTAAVRLSRRREMSHI